MTDVKPTEPSTPTDVTGTLPELLSKLGLLPTEAEAKAAAAKEKSEYSSVNVIAANRLKITEDVTGLIKWGGLGGAGASAVAAGVGQWNGWAVELRVALVLGAALVLFGAAIGLARVLDGDVRGRAAAAVAQLEARAEVSSAFISASATPANTGDAAKGSEPLTQPTEVQVLLALSAYDKVVVTSDKGTHRIRATRWSKSQGLELELGDGDSIQPSRVTAFSATQSK